MKSVFGKAKHPRLAKAISITSPTAFKKSISEVSGLKDFTRRQKLSALNLAKTRAKLQLNRSNLSPRERKEFLKISTTKISL